MQELTLEDIDAYLGPARKFLGASKEARILFENGSFARCNALALLASEEAGKAFMLQATGARLLMGHPVDWKKLKRRLADHKQK